LKRITAWIYRFISKFEDSNLQPADLKSAISTPVKQNGKIEPLTTAELDNALLHWIRIVQKDKFHEEINCIAKKCYPPQSTAR